MAGERGGIWRFSRVLAAIAPMSVILIGCSVGAFLSGGGSMRVEVDVYKGPLAKEPAVQWGELVALLFEFKGSLQQFDDSLTYRHRLHPHRRAGKSEILAGKAVGDDAVFNQVSAEGFADISKDTPSDSSGGAPTSDDLLEREIDSATYCESNDSKKVPNEIVQLPCVIEAQIHEDVHALKKHLHQLTLRDWTNGEVPFGTRAATSDQFVDSSKMQCFFGLDENGLCDANKMRAGYAEAVRFVEDISLLAGRLQVKAQYWTQAHVAINPSDRYTRGRIVTFANMMSQYAGQLSSRADVLLKQLKNKGETRTNGGSGKPEPVKFPLSVYLRDTELSEILNLYVWNRAAAPATWIDVIYHPIESLSSEETANRVRTAERVFDDTNWHRINEVFASGRGKVNLVLVKDEIGNWNLKTFDSDPTDLLAAYTNIAKNALQELAKSASPGITQVVEARTILATGVVPNPDVGTEGAETAEAIKALRQMYLKELTTLKEQALEDKTQEAKEARAITERYRSALADIRRLGHAGKLSIGQRSPPGTLPQH